MELIYKIINKCFVGLSEEFDREDIYQMGYIVLIDFIERYNPDNVFDNDCKN